MTEQEKYKVDEETATRDFERLCRGRRVDTNLDEMTPKEQKEFNVMKAAIIRLIREGRVEVHEDGILVTYRTFDKQTFTFKKAGGSTFMALETHDASKKIANLFEALADMSGVTAKKFTALEDVGDIKALSTLATLFLAPQ